MGQDMPSDQICLLFVPQTALISAPTLTLYKGWLNNVIAYFELQQAAL